MIMIFLFGKSTTDIIRLLFVKSLLWWFLVENFASQFGAQKIKNKLVKMAETLLPSPPQNFLQRPSLTHEFLNLELKK